MSIPLPHSTETRRGIKSDGGSRGCEESVRVDLWKKVDFLLSIDREAQWKELKFELLHGTVQQGP